MDQIWRKKLGSPACRGGGLLPKRLQGSLSRNGRMGRRVIGRSFRVMLQVTLFCVPFALWNLRGLPWSSMKGKGHLGGQITLVRKLRNFGVAPSSSASTAPLVTFPSSMGKALALKKEKSFVDTVRVHQVAIDDTHLAVGEVVQIEVRKGEAMGFSEDIHHCIVGRWGEL